MGSRRERAAHGIDGNVTAEPDGEIAGLEHGDGVSHDPPRTLSISVVPAERRAREPEPMNTELSMISNTVLMGPGSRSLRSLGRDDGA